MADITADVLRLFTTSGAFLGGSKRKQAGFASDTKRWLIHNDSDDTLAFGVSDDAYQLLLAGAQDISGYKTFLAGLKVSTDQSVDFGDGLQGKLYYDNSSGEMRIEAQSTTPLVIDTQYSTANVILKQNNVERARLDQYGLSLDTNKKIILGDSREGELSFDGTHTKLQSLDNSVVLDGQDGCIMRWGNGYTILTLESSGVKIASTLDLKLGVDWQSGAPTADGYVRVKDYSGNVIHLLCKKM